MAKFVMVYASMTGNTEEMANAIADGIREDGHEIEMNDILDISSASEFEQYDGVLLGAYTWGEGDLPDEFLDLYEEMDEVDLTGKIAAAFGSGDTVYDHFAGAVDLLSEKLKERGAEVNLEGLKVDTSPDNDDLERCKQFGKEFAQLLSKEENHQEAK